MGDLDSFTEVLSRRKDIYDIMLIKIYFLVRKHDEEWFNGFLFLFFKTKSIKKVIMKSPPTINYRLKPPRIKVHGISFHKSLSNLRSIARHTTFHTSSTNNHFYFDDSVTKSFKLHFLFLTNQPTNLKK